MKIQLDFVKHYKLWFLLSGMLVLVALLGIFMRGLNYGIDFTGGTQMVVKYPRPVTSAAVSRVLKKENLSQSQVLFMGSSHQEVQITTPTISEHERNLVLAKLKTVGNYQEISTNRVSGIVGAQTGRTALLAVLIATAAIIIYIAIRFEMRFALAGIIALLLDVVITVGVVALIHVTLTVYFIMAVLTIFGYSMNDRIIVFDRIRENLHKQRKNEPLEDVVNRSLNQVVMRSINTSSTVMLALAALLILGGASLRDFSVTMLLGVFFGTFTSLFVASPVWMLWRKRDDVRRGGGRPARAD
ncbi:MAG: protein translocase subunit SecF [Thermaerobacter sp.]|nr:protein translocase subunit SecF [Thermaerobacter sp.]